MGSTSRGDAQACTGATASARRALTVTLVWALILFAFTGTPAHALDPHKALTQYAHRAWQAKDGLPQNSVQAIAQTPDGYIWLGTQEGLARFDGISFTAFNRQNTPALKSNYIYALHVDRAGVLWIGTNGGGVTRLDNGRFSNYTTAEGLSDNAVHSIGEDRAGLLWLGTGRGVSRFSAGAFTPFTADAGLAAERVMSVWPDRDGGMWFGSYTNGLGRWHQGKFSRLTKAQGLSHNTVWSVYQDPQGVVWIGTLGGGLNRLEAGVLRRLSVPEGLPSDGVFGTRQDRDGNLWIATDGGGLVRLAGGRFSSLTRAQGLAGDAVWPLFEDRSGILWIGSLSGLSQLRDSTFTPTGAAEGLPEDIVRSVSQDRDGAMWIGGNSRGIARLKDGALKTYTSADGLVHDRVRTVFPDRAGNVWIGTVGGLSRFTDGRFTNFSMRDGLSSEKISALHEDGQGVLWIGTYGGGLNRFSMGRFESFGTREGLPNDRVLAIANRRAGGLWLATDGGGLAVYDAGKFTSYGTRDGLADNHLSALHEDADGNLWIGSMGGGLTRLRDGRFTVFTTRHGLPDELAHAILEDGQANLWISSNKGIYRVARRELDAVADGRQRTVRSTLFGIGDGMRSSECNGASQPSGWRSADGRLWFATMEGVVWVDPSALNAAPALVRTYIEKVIVDGQPMPASGARLPPGGGGLEFRYTALEYRQPNLLHFRYRLEGFDADWVDAGARRLAYYTNIPPGEYRFVVAAASGDAPWSDAPATSSFHLEPQIHQTAWFKALVLLLVVAGLAAAHYLRSRHLGRRAQVLKALVRQREAAEAQVRELNTDLESRVLARTAQLEEANRELESFSYSVSHDLRAPLRAMDGFSFALLQDSEARLDAKGRSLALRIRAASQRMGALIDDLLRLSDVTRTGLKWEEVDLSRLAREIAQSLQRRAPERSVRWEIADGLRVRADRRLMAIALSNLIENAWKYSEKVELPLIRVGAMPCDGRLQFCVCDNGAGFDMAYADKLFKAFQRLHRPDEFPGTGIGLAIVERIIRRHGGQIQARSATGHGATFIFFVGDEDRDARAVEAQQAGAQ